MGCFSCYGELEEKLINVFDALAPDFDAAEKLINLGADVNAVGEYDDENILSEIIQMYCDVSYRGNTSQECEYCNGDHCDECDINTEPLPERGLVLCKIIRFFLEHGFDITKNKECYGAQCLYALTLSTFDRYTIDATKILLDAGAKNRTVSLASTDKFDTPWISISAECSAQGTAYHDHQLENIYEAVYQIYQAIEDGNPYQGIDSYEVANGKKILKVLAEQDSQHSEIYDMDLPEYKKDNCFNRTLYLIYDTGALRITQYADIWTDTILPDKELVDVSDHFKDILNKTITGFAFDHKSINKGIIYGQPIVNILFDSGVCLKISINFGEVEDKNRAAWFEIIPNTGNCKEK